MRAWPFLTNQERCASHKYDDSDQHNRDSYEQKPRNGFTCEREHSKPDAHPENDARETFCFLIEISAQHKLRDEQQNQYAPNARPNSAAAPYSCG